MNDLSQPIAAADYLRYLPGVFAKSPDDFLGRYLKIFQKLLTGIDDAALGGRRGIQELLAAEVIGNLFYSRFSFLFPSSNQDFIPPISGLPADQCNALLALFNSFIGVPDSPHPLAAHVAALSDSDEDGLSAFKVWLDDFLVWLASWMDLVLDSSWTIDKKRLVIAEIMALYRLRGTAAGLGMLIDLLLDLPMQISCFASDGSQPVSGSLSVNVLNPQPPSIVVTATAGQADTFVLQCAYRPGAPLLSGYAPWLFQVQVVLPACSDATCVPDATGARQIQDLLARLASLLDAVKPAASRYQIQILGGMCLQPYPDPRRPAVPRPPQLNLNAVLGSQMPSP